MKISVTTYSFQQLKSSKKADEKRMVEIARDMGFDGIEVTSLLEYPAPEKYAEEFRAIAEENNMPVVAYTVNANLLNPDRESEINRLKRQIRIAKILGAPVMRHDAYFAFPENGKEDFDFYFDAVVSAFRETSDCAKEFGIKICTENHGLICQDSERIERIIKAVNSDNFGWLVDIGNFLCVDENPETAVSRAAKYAFHAHLKDFFRRPSPENCIITRHGQFIQGAPLGEGIVPVKKCVDILKSSGYNGFYTFEYEGAEDCLTALKRSLSFARTL